MLLHIDFVRSLKKAKLLVLTKKLCSEHCTKFIYLYLYYFFISIWTLFKHCKWIFNCINWIQYCFLHEQTLHGNVNITNYSRTVFLKAQNSTSLEKRSPISFIRKQSEFKFYMKFPNKSTNMEVSSLYARAKNVNFNWHN